MARNIDNGRENLIDRGRLTPSLSKPPWVLLRIGGGVAAAVAFGFSALVGFLFGGVTATDCFIECGGEPNLLVGIPILLGTAAVGALGLGALWWAFVDRYWKNALKVIGITGSIGAMSAVFPRLREPLLLATDQAIAEGEVFPEILERRIPGLVGAHLARADAVVDGEVEFTTIIWFESRDSVKNFMGEDYQQAHVPANAQVVLKR